MAIQTCVTIFFTLALATTAAAEPNTDGGHEFRFPTAGVEITLPQEWQQVHHRSSSEIGRWEVPKKQGEPSVQLTLHINPLHDKTLDEWLSELAQRAGAAVEDSSATIGGQKSKVIRTPKAVLMACRHKQHAYVLGLNGESTSDAMLEGIAKGIRFVAIQPPQRQLGKLTEKIALLNTGWTMKIPAPLRLVKVENEDSKYYVVQNYANDTSEMTLHVMRGTTTPERSLKSVLKDVGAGVEKASSSKHDVKWRSVRKNVSVMTALQPVKRDGQGDPYQIMGAVVRYDDGHFLWLRFAVSVSSAPVLLKYCMSIQAMVDTITPP